MPPATLALFPGFSRPALWMSVAGVVVLVIGLAAARNEVIRARGVDTIVALTYLCYAMPLAVFGTEHLVGQIPLSMVPRYMPWRVFWLYFVGIALIAASLSIATRIQVRWSGLLIGIMMFLFVAMLYLPGGLRGGGRFIWTIVFRETSFGAAGWVLAGIAMGANRRGKGLITAGRVLIAITAIFFAVEHFLHPLALPGVPLQKEMPAWIPAREWIDYATGAFLLAGGACLLAAWRTRQAATYLGAWIVLLVLVIYGPVMIGALGDPRTDVQIEGLNYFADTLLFGGVTLSLARAMTAVSALPELSDARAAAPA